MKDMGHLDDSAKLLTMINVAAARPTKRQRATQRDWHAIAKKAKPTASVITAKKATIADNSVADLSTTLAAPEQDSDDEDEQTSQTASRDSYSRHWAFDAPLVEGKSAAEMKEIKWSKSKKVISGLGQCTEFTVEGSPAKDEPSGSSIVRPRRASYSLTHVADPLFYTSVQCSSHEQAQRSHGPVWSVSRLSPSAPKFAC